MKRVAIVTVIIYNFGNRLQNYAVQEVLNGLGFLPETLRSPQSSKSRWQYGFQQLFKNPLWTAKKTAAYVTRKLFDNIRETNYKLFDNNITWGAQILQDGSPGEYDYYSIGSDQVWNPLGYDVEPWKKSAFLLAFVPPEKRICFSPSFGISKLPDEWKPLFKEELSKFRKISVREDAGAAIVKDLTGKDADVLIDPTCMLDMNQWMKIAKKPEGFDSEKPYILSYFLGGRSNRVNRDLKNYASRYDLRVCNLSDPLARDLYLCGPSEFVWLMAHAKLILTDSFHGSVFSFLFQKPFVVYDRNNETKNESSRIETLLKKFDLQRKFADSGLPNDLFECDYQRGYEQLKKEREKARRFLLESLAQ